MTLEVIADEDELWRRVPDPHPNYIKEDNSISSAAFLTKKGSDGLSVNLARLSNYDESILDRSKFRLCAIDVRTVKRLGNSSLDVIHNPQPENYAHCLIVGIITRAMAKEMARLARTVSAPE